MKSRKCHIIVMSLWAACMLPVQAQALGGAHPGKPHGHVNKTVAQGKNSLISNAFNYQQSANVSVSSRTGMLSVQVPLATLPLPYGGNFPLALRYAQIGQVHQSYNITGSVGDNAPGWSLALPYVQVRHHGLPPILHLASGAAYQYSSQSLTGLVYYSLNNMHFQKTSIQDPCDHTQSSDYVLKSLGGEITYFDQFGNEQCQVDRWGHQIKFVWGNSSGQDVISNGAGQSIVIMPGQEVANMPDSGFAYATFKNTYQAAQGTGSFTVTRHYGPQQKQTRSVAFHYGGAPVPTYISSISYQAQQTAKVNMGINYQSGQKSIVPWESLYAVKSLTTQTPGAENLLAPVYYQLGNNQPGDNTFLGYAEGSQDPCANSATTDCVMQNSNGVNHNVPNNYTYVTYTSKPNPKGFGYVVDQNTYNHLHLKIASKVYEAAQPNAYFVPGTTQEISDTQYWYAGQCATPVVKGNQVTEQCSPNTTESEYGAVVSKNPNYQSPVKIESTVFNLPSDQFPTNTKNWAHVQSVQPNQSRTTVSMMAYNDYGQKTTSYITTGSGQLLQVQKMTYDDGGAGHYGLPLSKTVTAYDLKTGAVKNITQTLNTTTAAGKAIGTSQALYCNVAAGAHTCTPSLEKQTTMTYETSPEEAGLPATKTISWGAQNPNHQLQAIQTRYTYSGFDATGSKLYNNLNLPYSLYDPTTHQWHTQFVNHPNVRAVETQQYFQKPGQTTWVAVNRFPSLTLINNITGRVVQKELDIEGSSNSVKHLAGQLPVSNTNYLYDSLGRLIDQTVGFDNQATNHNYMAGKALFIQYGPDGKTLTEYGNLHAAKGKAAVGLQNTPVPTPISQTTFDALGRPVATFTNANAATGAYDATADIETGSTVYSPWFGKANQSISYVPSAGNTSPTALMHSTLTYDPLGRPVLQTSQCMDASVCRNTGVYKTETEYLNAYQLAPTNPLLATNPSASKKGYRALTRTIMPSGQPSDGVRLVGRKTVNDLGQTISQATLVASAPTLLSQAGQTSPNTLLTSYAYNSRGELLTETSADASKSNLYNGLGQLSNATVTDTGKEAGLPSAMRLAMLQDGDTLNTQATYHYSLVGKPIVTTTTMSVPADIKNYQGHGVTYYTTPLKIYDAAGDLLQILPYQQPKVKPGASLTLTNTPSNLSQFDLNHAVSFEYNKLGDMIAEHFWGGTTYWYYYTATGKKIDSCYTLNHQALAQPVQNGTTGGCYSANAFGHVHYQYYDNDGALTGLLEDVTGMPQTTDPSHMVAGSIHYGYYQNGQLETITYPPVAKQPARTIHYTYDSMGNEKTVTDYLGNVTTYQYQLLAGQWVIKQAVQTNPKGAVLSQVEYDYYSSGRLRQKDVLVGQGAVTPLTTAVFTGSTCAGDAAQGFVPNPKALASSYYTYDKWGRVATMAHVFHGGAMCYGYRYYQDGKLNTKTLQANVPDLLKPSRIKASTGLQTIYSKTYHYVLGKLLNITTTPGANAAPFIAKQSAQKAYRFNAAGNLKTAGSQNMVYNNVNQLTQITPTS